MKRTRFQLIFLAMALCLPTLFRVWLWAGRQAELSDLGAGGTATMFWTGLRLDGVVAGALTLPTCFALLLIPRRWLRGTLVAARVYAGLLFTTLVAVELCGLQFFSFYDFKPNYLVLDHGADTEVVETIMASYPVFGIAVGTLLMAAAATWALCRLVPLPARSPGPARTAGPASTAGPARAADSSWVDQVSMVAVLVITAIVQRGTLDHRPLNPSAAAFSSNRLANEVAGSGFFNVVYEALARRSGSYGALEDCLDPLDDDDALAAARAHLAPTGRFVADGLNPLVRAVRGVDAVSHPQNVVFIVLESYTGRLIGHLGGELSLSPQLDALANEGLALTRCYATGERTVQGLEATLSSFPPQPGIAAVKRPKGQLGFDTLATVLGRKGYATTFVYGGQGEFDHMQGFFLGNGYDRFIEEPDFESPEFVGSWGVCDDDIYRRVITEARDYHDAGRPFLVTALSISLHSPWEYPDGHIEELPTDIAVPKGFEYEELNTFLYADSAVGNLMDAAREEPWFDDTLFVFVGDHGVHLRGRLTVPVEEYRVPAIFYAPAHLEPRRYGGVTSQLDLSPTVLGILGGEHRTTFFGHDLGPALQAQDAGQAPVEGWAPMIYRKHRYGIVSGSRLTLLDPEGADAAQVWRDGDWQAADMTPAHAADARAAKGVLQSAAAFLDAGTYSAVSPSRP